MHLYVHTRTFVGIDIIYYNIVVYVHSLYSQPRELRNPLRVEQYFRDICFQPQTPRAWSHRITYTSYGCYNRVFVVSFNAFSSFTIYLSFFVKLIILQYFNRYIISYAYVCFGVSNSPDYNIIYRGSPRSVQCGTCITAQRINILMYKMFCVWETCAQGFSRKNVKFFLSERYL